MIDQELLELGGVAARLGVRLGDPRLLTASRDQAAFFGSQFTLLAEPWRAYPHALATAYFHGRPGTPGMPEFDTAYEALAAHHGELERVQVTHAEMHDLVLASGIDPAKVFRIRIGVDVDLFPQRTTGRPVGSTARSRTARSGVRRRLVPEGRRRLGRWTGAEAHQGARRARRGDAHSARTTARADGPALPVPRAVSFAAGLERHGIPYVHVRPETYEGIARLYAALDAYVVPSRQEGGPKSVLESMASGVPIVSTRSGQATELIDDGVNGRLVDVEDAEALADALADDRLPGLVGAARETALANDKRTQEPLWRAFFEGFVAHA